MNKPHPTPDLDDKAQQIYDAWMEMKPSEMTSVCQLAHDCYDAGKRQHESEAAAERDRLKAAITEFLDANTAHKALPEDAYLVEIHQLTAAIRRREKAIEVMQELTNHLSRTTETDLMQKEPPPITNRRKQFPSSIDAVIAADRKE